MKKYLVVVMLSLFLMTTGFAAVKAKSAISLDFTMTYKSDATISSAEHVIKNSVQLSENKWVVAGKLQASKSDDVLLFLVRMLSHKNNKFNLEFMLIDSTSKNTAILMPHVAAMAGLPVQLTQKEDNGKTMQMNVLVNLDGARKG